MYCPRCEEEGKIHKWRVRAMEKTVVLWSCDECDTSWEDVHSISTTNLGQDFELLLESKYGIDYRKAEMTILGDLWLLWFDKVTQEFVGRTKLKIHLEELRYFDAHLRLETRISLEGASLDDLVGAFGGIQMKGLPTLGIYEGICTLNPKRAKIFQPSTDIQIDLSKYYYFVEFDSEVDGKITAESENYPAIFVPRQAPGFFDEE